MSLLFRVIYAAHARGSHHKLALDALAGLRTPDAELWRRLLLKHAETYLLGSKAPDNEFKDFKNHVLHVDDGYWGGALVQTRAWYGRLIGVLRAGSWSEAAYAAGVLSHYVADPIHPFHTGQSEAESHIHRALEWSTATSYDALKKEWPDAGSGALPALPDGPDWLERLVCQGAEHAHGHYHTLLVHYDFHKGVVDPPAGLDAQARRALAGLIATAAATIAIVLDRAFTEAGVAPPKVALTLDTVLATLTVPRKWVLNTLADAADRRQVQATGNVDRTLTEDDRTIRDLHAKEVRGAAGERQTTERAARIRAAAASVIEPAVARGRQAAPADRRNDQAQRLSATDPVEAAPSIGAKTAKRLDRIGLKTVADLLAAKPAFIADQLATRHIDARVVSAWQDQARLVMALPGLSGTNAQLLTSAGYTSLESLALTTADAVAAALTRIVASPEGERLLRGGRTPGAEQIQSWIEVAKQRPAKAA